MKTTVEIQDQLFVRAQRKARREGRSMRSVIEEGLRLALDAESVAESLPPSRLERGRTGLSRSAEVDVLGRAA